MRMTSAKKCTRPKRFVEFVIILAHWSNSSRVHLSLHSDTLSWFRTTQSLLLMLRTDLESWHNRGSNSRSTAFKANTLTIKLLIRFVWKVGSDNTNKITTKVARFEKHCYTLEIVLRDWFSVLNGKLRIENRNVRTIGLTSTIWMDK
jgi:hypothetical protein